jgi:hypothetical protein
MKTIAYMCALALLATIAACSSSDQQRGANTQCSPYDPQCRLSQAPGLNSLLPPDQSISQMRQGPMAQ